MSRLTELYNDVTNVLVGYNSKDIMAVLTAVTAAVLDQSMLDGQTVDTAMVVFKKQVQQHIDIMRRAQ